MDEGMGENGMLGAENAALPREKTALEKENGRKPEKKIEKSEKATAKALAEPSAWAAPTYRNFKELSSAC